MENTLFMSVDLGTSFIKVGVYNTTSDCIALASEAVSDERPRPGVFIQRGEDLFQSVLSCIKKTVKQLGELAFHVEAIVFTGQMAGFMGVDKNWNDITSWSCSLDTRYLPYAEKQMKQYSKEFLHIAGTNCPQMASKFEWFQTEFPEESKKIEKYMIISGFILGKLGEVPIEEAVIDRTFLQWTGFADIRKLEWSDEICHLIGMDKKHLPRIVASNEICGRLSGRNAELLGLKPGIALVSGAGDKPAGCVGAAIFEKGDMIFEAASYGGFSCVVEEYVPNIRMDVVPMVTGKGYYAHYYIPGSGITFDWFVNTFVRRNEEDIASLFMELDKKVEKVPIGSEGIMAIGLLGGSAMPLDGEIRGMWMGHNWSHKIEHFYRSLQESFAYEIGITIQKIQELYPDYNLSDIKIIGGGAKSKVWSQMLADVTEKTFMRINREDIAMWGSAILAGNAIGIFKDIKETARRYVGIKSQYYPDKEKGEVYKMYMELYKKFVIELHDFYAGIEAINKTKK